MIFSVSALWIEKLLKENIQIFFYNTYKAAGYEPDGLMIKELTQFAKSTSSNPVALKCL